MVRVIAYYNANHWTFEGYTMIFTMTYYDCCIQDSIYTMSEVRRMLDIDSKIGTPRTTNCPNCGAPITSWKCEYCETVFDDSNGIYWEE